MSTLLILLALLACTAVGLLWPTASARPEPVRPVSGERPVTGQTFADAFAHWRDYYQGPRELHFAQVASFAGTLSGDRT